MTTHSDQQQEQEQLVMNREEALAVVGALVQQLQPQEQPKTHGKLVMSREEALAVVGALVQQLSKTAPAQENIEVHTEWDSATGNHRLDTKHEGVCAMTVVQNAMTTVQDELKIVRSELSTVQRKRDNELYASVRRARKQEKVAEEVAADNGATTSLTS